MTDARNKIQTDLLRKEERDGSQVAPMIDQKDIDFIAQTKIKLSQKDILRMYVGNWADMDLKQRRKVLGFI